MGEPDPTRDPLSPPFSVGTHLRCVEGNAIYVSRVSIARELADHPEDWARVSGRGLEVTIVEVRVGRRGTGRQLRDADGEPMIDDTKDGYSVYRVEGRAAKLSGRCIYPDAARRWQVLPAVLLVEVGDLIREGSDFGIVLASGSRAFDVVWLGGSTTRYRHGARDIQIVGRVEVDAHTREHLEQEALAARNERRVGARIRRGAVSPRR